jgi:hypothetical protein
MYFAFSQIYTRTQVSVFCKSLFVILKIDVSQLFDHSCTVWFVKNSTYINT